MLPIFDPLREFSFLSVICRLALAVAAGAVIGFERSYKRRTTGFPTYTIICAGAATTILIALGKYDLIAGVLADAADLAELKYDAARYAAQVLTGIGFLAAGTIITIEHSQKKGLTTATGLFATACLGIAAGVGLFECVIVAVILIIFCLEVLKPIEVAYRRRRRNLTICVEYDAAEDLAAIEQIVEDRDGRIDGIEIEGKAPGRAARETAIFVIRLSRENASHSAMMSSIAELPCVASVQELIY